MNMELVGDALTVHITLPTEGGLFVSPSMLDLASTPDISMRLPEISDCDHQPADSQRNCSNELAVIGSSVNATKVPVRNPQPPQPREQEMRKIQIGKTFLVMASTWPP
jgi:hypothetical protein